MKRPLLVAGIIALSPLFAPRSSGAATPPSGSYTLTCNSISADGTVLTATCATGTGIWKTTQLKYANCQGDVWNAYGHLVCVNGEPVGSYEITCQSIAFGGTWLTASCRTIAGSWVGTRIDVPSCTGDIANMNGVLTCGAYSCSYSVNVECWNSSRQGDYFYYTAVQQCGTSSGDAARRDLSGYPQCGSAPCCYF